MIKTKVNVVILNLCGLFLRCLFWSKKNPIIFFLLFLIFYYKYDDKFSFVKNANAITSVSATEFKLPIFIGKYFAYITLGSDNNLWFTELGGNSIGRITKDGTITEFLLPNSNSYPFNITSGPDGNLWFTELSGRIGKITPQGIITEFFIPNDKSSPRGITTGSDGKIWFADTGGHKIGQITQTGIVTEFPLPNSESQPEVIITGLDGNMWFTQPNLGSIGKITVEGVITEFNIPTQNVYYVDLAAAPDGNIWFTESYGSRIGKITPDGAITEYLLPNTPTTPTTQIHPFNITVGPDNNLWFNVYTIGSEAVFGRITLNGEITLFGINPIVYAPYDLTMGPDGNIWFTEFEGNAVGRFNVAFLPKDFLQVPILKQGVFPFNNNDPIWEANEYDHGNSQSLWCGNTIANCGCAVTSLAMILQYYGIVDPLAGDITTPSTVNNYFKRNTHCGSNGCSSLGYAFGDVRWTAVNNYAAEAYKNYGTQKIIYDGGGSYDPSIVEQDINNSRPVILGVPNHWVVATGISNNTFAINDPLFSRNYLNDPAYNNTAVQGMRRYKITHSDFSSFEVAALAPANVIITDPEGNKTGFNIDLSSAVENIPNSSYFLDQEYANSTEQPASEGKGVNWAIVTTPQEGEYTVEVNGSPNQDYAFTVYGSDHDATTKLKLFEGKLPTNGSNKYVFDYSPTSSDHPISLSIKMDVKPGDDENRMNIKNNDVLPVAILSTTTFDATKIDPLSVEFGIGKAKEIHNKGHIEDVNKDKKQDLVFHFNSKDSGINFGDSQVCLVGLTTDGFTIKGCGIIKVIP